jgi:hypothetical protein
MAVLAGELSSRFVDNLDREAVLVPHGAAVWQDVCVAMGVRGGGSPAQQQHSSCQHRCWQAPVHGGGVVQRLHLQHSSVAAV